jgi:hypothetical protein
MKLTLATNIGAKDAKRLGLDKTLRGDAVTVKDDVADLLLKNGWAVRTDGKAKAPVEAEDAIDENPPPAAKDGGGHGNDDFSPLTDADRRRVAQQNRENAAEAIRAAADEGKGKGAKSK